MEQSNLNLILFIITREFISIEMKLEDYEAKETGLNCASMRKEVYISKNILELGYVA